MSEGQTDRLRWPEPGDRPFRSGSRDVRLAVDMDWARGQRHAANLYTLGYKRAADALFETLSSRASEMVVFPYLFLWRQHIELSLKRSIVLVRHVLDIDEAAPRGHRLPPLWLTLRTLLEEDGDLGNEVRQSFDVADVIIQDLERIDPNSLHSRYAEGFTADYQVESLAGLPRHFDIAHFHQVATSLSNLFECVDAEFTTRLDAQMELLARAELD